MFSSLFLLEAEINATESVRMDKAIVAQTVCSQTRSLAESEHIQRVSRETTLELRTKTSQNLVHQEVEKPQAVRVPRPSSFPVLKRVARRTYFPERVPLQVTNTQTISSSSSSPPLSCAQCTKEEWHDDLQFGIEMLAAIQITRDNEMY